MAKNLTKEQIAAHTNQFRLGLQQKLNEYLVAEGHSVEDVAERADVTVEELEQMQSNTFEGPFPTMFRTVLVIDERVRKLMGTIISKPRK